MSVINLITTADADTYNALSSDWIALDPSLKSAHIFNASMYMQTVWICADVDWEDTSTLNDDLKLACALYAEASRLGSLYPAMSPVEEHGRITEESKMVGPLKKVTKWSSIYKTTTKRPLKQPDALMSIWCSRIGAVLQRV